MITKNIITFRYGLQRALTGLFALGLFVLPSISSAQIAQVTGAGQVNSADGTTLYYSFSRWNDGYHYTKICVIPDEHEYLDECKNSDESNKNFLVIGVESEDKYVHAYEAFICSESGSACFKKSQERLGACIVGDKYLLGTSATSGPQLELEITDCETASGGGFSLKTYELEVSVEATDSTASEEGQQAGEFTITRSGSTAEELIVEFTLSGTATNGVDYNQVAPSITIPAGESSGTVEIIPIDDQDTAEPDETVTLTLIDPVEVDEADIINGGRPTKSKLMLSAKVIGNPAQIIIINYAHLPANSQDIPTLQEWGLILLSVLLLLVSGFYSRKRSV